jgi:phosphate/sulfate permease
VKPVVLYSIIRIVLFLGLVAVLVPLLDSIVPPWVSTIIAAIMAFCISYLAFGTLRKRVADDLAASRASKQTSTVTVPTAASDEAVEDGEADASAAREAVLERDRGTEPKAE